MEKEKRRSRISFKASKASKGGSFSPSGKKLMLTEEKINNSKYTGKSGY